MEADNTEALRGAALMSQSRSHAEEPFEPLQGAALITRSSSHIAGADEEPFEPRQGSPEPRSRNASRSRNTSMASRRTSVTSVLSAACTVRESFHTAVITGSQLYGAELQVNGASQGSWVEPGMSSRLLTTPARPGRARELVASLVMVLCGSLGSFFGSLIYRLSPTRALSGAESIVSDIWLTYCLTLGVFLFCALGAGLSRANRVALCERATPLFLGVLLIPSSMDLVITGLSTLALAFTQPALVGILKNATQLAVLSGASRLVLHKRLSCSQWLSLLAVMGGVAILALNAVLFKPPAAAEEVGAEKGSGEGGSGEGGSAEGAAVADQAIGISLACVAGALGAWRNLAEAAILQDGGMPASALLLAESSLSALLLGGAGAVAFAVAQSVPRLDAKEDASLENMVRLLSLPIVPPMLVAYLLCAYGKDVGKFWLIKYASALRQKVLALLFPFGTWAVSLATFYLAAGRRHSPTLGSAWDPASSWVEAAAFILILGANVVFVRLKEKTSCPARWCAKIDARC